MTGRSDNIKSELISGVFGKYRGEEYPIVIEYEGKNVIYKIVLADNQMIPVEADELTDVYRVTSRAIISGQEYAITGWNHSREYVVVSGEAVGLVDGQFPLEEVERGEFRARIPYSYEHLEIRHQYEEVQGLAPDRTKIPLHSHQEQAKDSGVAEIDSVVKVVRDQVENELRATDIALKVRASAPAIDEKTIETIRAIYETVIYGALDDVEKIKRELYLA